MGTFASHMATAYADLATEFGEAVVYSPPSGDDVAVDDAVWNEDPGQAVAAAHGELTRRTTTCTIRTAHVAAPVQYATVTRTSTGETWTVASPPQPLAGAHLLALARPDRIELGEDELRDRLP